MSRSSRRPLPRVLIGAVALLLQLLTPALHQLHAATPLASHGEAAARSAPAHDVVTHDAQSCVFCAAAAQARAGALTGTAAPIVLAAAIEGVPSRASHVTSAPPLTGGAPRAPPTLA